MTKLTFFLTTSLPVFETEVASQSWIPFNLGTQDTLRAVTFKLGIGYVVGDVFGTATGDSSVILQTYDRGVTWVRKTFATSGRLNERRRLYSIHWSYLTNGPSTWWSVHCTGNTCYGASDQNVYKSTDFALTWSGLINSGSGGRNAYAVYCMNLDTCTWGGSLGMIRKTVDGGTSWSTKSSGVTQSLRATYQSGGNVGWTVGDTGIILKINDSGSTWSTQVSGTARNLYSVFFGSHPGFPVLGLGFIVGAGGTMLRYSPTVGILPRDSIKRRLSSHKKTLQLDTRGKYIEGKPCHNCLFDPRKN